MGIGLSHMVKSISSLSIRVIRVMVICMIMGTGVVAAMLAAWPWNSDTRESQAPGNGNDRSFKSLY